MQIIAYPNCSKGGVSTVIRNRALSQPNTEFLALFLNDRGGRTAFADLENVRVEIVSEAVIGRYLQYLLETYPVSGVSILNLPEVANFIAKRAGERLTYEFHSSDLPWIKRELSRLQIGDIQQISVPSKQMYEVLKNVISPEERDRLSIIPNGLSTSIFTCEGKALDVGRLAGAGNQALLWIGRLEWRKGDVDFLRLLALLPDHFFGVAIISLENDEGKVERFLSEATQLGISKRVMLLMDLDQAEVAQIMRGVRETSGWFVSTSYNESYGYAVREALGCGLRIAAYEPEVPVWEDLRYRDDTVFGTAGNLASLAGSIIEQG